MSSKLKRGVTLKLRKTPSDIGDPDLGLFRINLAIRITWSLLIFSGIALTLLYGISPKFKQG